MTSHASPVGTCRTPAVNMNQHLATGEPTSDHTAGRAPPTSNDPMSDPTLAQIEALADQWHSLKEEAGRKRVELNALIQWAKDNGYSYPQLSRASSLSVATIQNIVAGRYLGERHQRGDY